MFRALNGNVAQVGWEALKQNEDSSFAKNPCIEKGRKLKKPTWLYGELSDRPENNKAASLQEMEGREGSPR